MFPEDILTSGLIQNKDFPRKQTEQEPNGHEAQTLTSTKLN
jgi:hypothetical protein